MTQTFDAIFENGVFRPLTAVAVAEHTKVRVSIESDRPQHPLLKHGGTLPDEDAREILKTIEDEFGKVNPDDWK